MITLENDQLIFRFPELHDRATLAVDFQRTCRIPDDGQEYPLPAGLGRFPLQHVDDFASRLDEKTRERAGVMLPMHPSEAMWINFPKVDWLAYPLALKIAAGKVNAVTGGPWSPDLNSDPQDYLVVPHQPWIDGFAISKGVIRQFVAERLGGGFSVEEQLTGKSEFGGLQIIAYPMKAERYHAVIWRPEMERRGEEVRHLLSEARGHLADLKRQLADTADELEDVVHRSLQGDVDAVKTLSTLRERAGQLVRRLEGRTLRRDGLYADDGPSFCMPRGSVFEAETRMGHMGMAAGGRMRQHIYKAWVCAFTAISSAGDARPRPWRTAMTRLPTSIG